MSTKATDFGLDAPYIVRNLFIVCLLLAAAMFFSFFITSRPWFWVCFTFSTVLFLHFFATACWMLYSTVHIKPLLVKEMVNRLKLEGNEMVLDAGCGRGILLIEVAKHLERGLVHGIDIWSTRDQSDNSFATTLHNIAASELTDRVKLYTADMRKLPYPDGMFDLVVSSLAIHNISDRAGRERVLLEILRVLRPHGRFSILDIQFAENYAAFLNETGKAKVVIHPKIHRYCPPIQLIEGYKL